MRATKPNGVTDRSLWQALLIPSLSDCLFIALIVWLFLVGSGWATLLEDGDTGWHIRTGEYILEHHRVPDRDLFSFSKPGAPWFAWEWLSDMVFALVYRGWGLKGVVLLAGTVLALALTILFRFALWRSTNILVALGTTLAAAGASNVHFLARPHIFTLLMLPVSLWLLSSDLRRPSRRIWWLVPLTVLWTNVHGGFVALLVSLGLCTVSEAVGRRKQRLQRYSLLTAACTLATLLNPLGYRLHLHILEYLRSSWIRDVVEEFQSPKFRSESMLQFEILLFLGLGLLAPLIRSKQYFSAALVLFWAQAALGSVRHVPVYAFVVSPIVAEQLSRAWDGWACSRPARSWAGAIRSVVADLSVCRRSTSIWAPALISVLLFARVGIRWPVDFSAARFPVMTVNRHLDRFTGREPPHVFTTDQWGDYLLYRFYPHQKVFVDGRSDFYGPSIGRQYQALMGARHDWSQLFERHGFELALIPADWPLTELLKTDPEWRILDDDGRALLFERQGRHPPRLNKSNVSAERVKRGPKG